MWRARRLLWWRGTRFNYQHLTDCCQPSQPCCGTTRTGNSLLGRGELKSTRPMGATRSYKLSLLAPEEGRDEVSPPCNPPQVSAGPALQDSASPASARWPGAALPSSPGHSPWKQPAARPPLPLVPQHRYAS